MIMVYFLVGLELITVSVAVPVKPVSTINVMAFASVIIM
jgi:hypothetical protein